MQSLLEYVVKGLVDQPGHVEIRQMEGEEGVKFLVLVAERDAGIVIGKRGFVVKAIRQLLKYCGQQNRLRVFLDVEAHGAASN